MLVVHQVLFDVHLVHQYDDNLVPFWAGIDGRNLHQLLIHII